MPTLPRWTALIVGTLLVLIMGGRLWLSYAHPYPFGVSLHSSTVVSKEKHTTRRTTAGNGGTTVWNLTVKLDDAGGNQTVFTGLHNLKGKDVGDHVQVYQGKASDTWHLRDYPSAFARLRNLAGAVLGVFLLAVGVFGLPLRRSMPRSASRG